MALYFCSVFADQIGSGKRTMSTGITQVGGLELIKKQPKAACVLHGFLRQEAFMYSNICVYPML